MGNIVTHQGGKLKDTTILGKKIKEILKNDEDFKKRACCRNNNDVNISLPTLVDSKNQAIKDLTKPLPADTTFVPSNVSVKIFTPEEYQKAETCTFDSQDFKKTDGTSKTPNTTCDNFYLNFCDGVYANRKKTYTGNSSFYGPYADNKENSNLDNPNNITNEFKDCNCVNSIWRRDADYLKVFQKGSNTSGLDSDKMAQNQDTKCGNNVANNNSYVENYLVSPNFCANFSSLQQSNANNFALNQSCASAGNSNTNTNTNNTNNNTTNNTNNNNTNSNTNTTNTTATPPSNRVQPTPSSNTSTSSGSSGPTGSGSSNPTTITSTSDASQFIKGVPNIVLYAVGGFFVFMILMIMLMSGGGKRRRRNYDDD